MRTCPAHDREKALVLHARLGESLLLTHLRTYLVTVLWENRNRAHTVSAVHHPQAGSVSGFGHRHLAVIVAQTIPKVVLRCLGQGCPNPGTCLHG